MNKPSSSSRPALVGMGAVLALVCLVVGFNWLAAFKAVAPSDVCVVQEGGPFDGRGISEVRQPSERRVVHRRLQHPALLPGDAAQLRHLARPRASRAGRDARLLRDADLRRRAGPHRGPGAVHASTPTRRSCATFYRKYGVRTFDGQHPYEGAEGWASFLAVQFRPVLDNALREAIGKYRCVQLNNTCAYVQDSAAAVERQGRGQPRQPQNLGEVAGRDRRDARGGPARRRSAARTSRTCSSASCRCASTPRSRRASRARPRRARTWRRSACRPSSASRPRSASAAWPSRRRAPSARPAAPTARTRRRRASTPSGRCRRDLQALGGNLSAIVGGQCSGGRRGRPRLHRRGLAARRSRPLTARARRPRGARRRGGWRPSPAPTARSSSAWPRRRHARAGRARAAGRHGPARARRRAAAGPRGRRACGPRAQPFRLRAWTTASASTAPPRSSIRRSRSSTSTRSAPTRADMLRRAARQADPGRQQVDPLPRAARPRARADAGFRGIARVHAARGAVAGGPRLRRPRRRLPDRRPRRAARAGRATRTPRARRR